MFDEQFLYVDNIFLFMIYCEHYQCFPDWNFLDGGATMTKEPTEHKADFKP